MIRLWPCKVNPCFIALPFERPEKMSKILEQDNRFARLNTPLGKDVLVLVNLEGNEGVSEGFEWRVDCLLNFNQTLDPQALIGKPCWVEMDTPSGEKRYFHGLCSEIRYCSEQGDYRHYKIVLRPWTWLLTRETACEIFHEKSVKDVIQQIFNDRGFSDFKFSLSKSYDPMHYCVQYQETTLNFVARLMEKFGLFYYFNYTDSKHELVITDDISSLPTAYGTIRYQGQSGIGIHDDRIFEWEAEDRLRTGFVDVDDYNYEKPNTALEKTGTSKDGPSHSYAQQRHYRYPTGHYDPGAGQLLADVLIDVERADAQRKFGAGYAPLLRAGAVFKLADSKKEEENIDHFAVSVSHMLTVNRGASGSGQDDHYECFFHAVDKAKPFKVPERTPRPRIAGAQTAEVIRSKDAPADEEIDVDDQGRILVRFHWNPKQGGQNQCSCRVRVAQIWAGSGWGGVWIPRVGMEVVVDFLNGDPDRPLVTGCVYNGNNAPPIKFPADKTQSTIKSQSSKGGTSADNFNELRFEDKKDDEEIYIHAERDRKMIIEHDDDIEIGNDQTIKITGSRTEEITGGDETITLKGDAGTKDKYGSGNAKNGHRTVTLEKGDETLKVSEGKRTTTIKMDDSRTITDGNDKHTISKGNQTVTISKGNQSTKISAGQGTVQAMKKYEIKVGAAKITMQPSKIVIKAPQVEIEGSMTLKTKGGIQATHEAGAMNTIKGGIVKIN